MRELARRGVGVPSYDRARLVGRIAHIGVGGFHRAHLARYVDELAAAGSTWGIIGVGLLPQDEAMAAALGAQDHLYTLIERGPANRPSRWSAASSTTGSRATTRRRAVEVLAQPDVAIISLTITEAGYVEGAATFDVLARALAVRHARGLGPVTLMSCDNVPGNGDATRRATLAAAAAHGAGAPRVGPRPSARSPTRWSTASPRSRPTPIGRGSRDDHGVDDRWPVVAEPFRQWVVEDAFAAGRPRWEDAGVLISDRVHDWELYKLRLLNASHSSMAYLGQLAGLTFVDEAMMAPAVRQFLERLLLDEAVPSLVEIPGHPREDYVASVLGRFANGGVRDQLARLCIDGTAKFATFLVPTIVHQLANARTGRAISDGAGRLGPVPRRRPRRRAGARRLTAVWRGRWPAVPATRIRCASSTCDEVFPAAVRDSDRFRSAFSRAWQDVGDRGPLAAMGA